MLCPRALVKAEYCSLHQATRCFNFQNLESEKAGGTSPSLSSA